jgi:hypothetical protein
MVVNCAPPAAAPPAIAAARTAAAWRETDADRFGGMDVLRERPRISVALGLAFPLACVAVIIAGLLGRDSEVMSAAE